MAMLNNQRVRKIGETSGKLRKTSGNFWKTSENFGSWHSWHHVFLWLSKWLEENKTADFNRFHLIDQCNVQWFPVNMFQANPLTFSQLPKRCCSQCNIQSLNSGKLLFLSWGVYYGLLQKMKPLTHLDGPRPSGEKWEVHSCFWCTSGKLRETSENNLVVDIVDILFFDDFPIWDRWNTKNHWDFFPKKCREKSPNNLAMRTMRTWALESLESLEQEGETTRLMSAWMLTNSRSKQQYIYIIYIYIFII